MIGLADILDFLKENQSRLDELPELKIGVIRNVTIEQIEVPLRYGLAKNGWRASVEFGGYQTILSDTRGEHAILGSDTNFVLVYLHLEALHEEFVRIFPQFSGEKLQDACTAIVRQAADQLALIREATEAPMAWILFELPVYPAYGGTDSCAPDRQTETVSDLNREVRRLLAEDGRAFPIDPNPIVQRLGVDRFRDRRFWRLSQAPSSFEALSEIAWDVTAIWNGLNGKTKKCLILDCDNTLWGGIVGEDGLGGLLLGVKDGGAHYRALQQQALSLHYRGVILTLCSKNNPQDVWEVFDSHPEMVLRRSHIAAAALSWEDKATGIRQIAQQLNIGLDSCVFVDDNPAECELVRQMIPEVEVLSLAEIAPQLYAEELAGYRGFDTVSVSAEDRLRGSHYQMETARKAALQQSASPHDYYESLQMTLRISECELESVPRVAQLIQRSNQFNLTTRRRPGEQIRAWCGSADHLVFTADLSDRFGDLGIIGVAIIAAVSERLLEIDTFLMSCRALGREAEAEFLDQVLALASGRYPGASFQAGYNPTPKNGQVSNFYDRAGFELKEEASSGEKLYIIKSREDSVHVGRFVGKVEVALGSRRSNSPQLSK